MRQLRATTRLSLPRSASVDPALRPAVGLRLAGSRSPFQCRRDCRLPTAARPRRDCRLPAAAPAPPVGTVARRQPCSRKRRGHPAIRQKSSTGQNPRAEEGRCSPWIHGECRRQTHRKQKAHVAEATWAFDEASGERRSALSEPALDSEIVDRITELGVAAGHGEIS